MRWKLTTLIENHADKEERYVSEHGLSILIESEDQKPPVQLLMDTGQSGMFYDNAVKMGILLGNLNALLISHAHYDHAGGVKMLLEKATVEKMYVGKDFFHKKYYEKKDGILKNIGITFSREELEQKGISVCELKKDMNRIFPGVTLYRNFERSVEYETLNPHFFVEKEEDGYINNCSTSKVCDSLETGKESVVDNKDSFRSDSFTNDSFTDEIAVALDTEKGIVVIVGCSHPGIMNILKTIEQRSGKKICGVVGGTHLMEADEERLSKTIAHLKEMNIDFIAVSHCTGEDNLEIIKESFGEKFIFNCTGNIIRF